MIDTLVTITNYNHVENFGLPTEGNRRDRPTEWYMQHPK